MRQESLAILIYIVGAFVTHYYIYKDEDPYEIEHQSANVACVLWPLTWAIYLLINIEKFIKNLFE